MSIPFCPATLGPPIVSASMYVVIHAVYLCCNLSQIAEERDLDRTWGPCLARSSALYHEFSAGAGSEWFGGQVKALDALICFSSHSWKVVEVCVCVGSYGAIRGSTTCAIMFGWAITATWMAGAKFHCRQLLCDKIKVDIHWACQCFWVLGWSVCTLWWQQKNFMD